MNLEFKKIQSGVSGEHILKFSATINFFNKKIYTYEL